MKYTTLIFFALLFSIASSASAQEPSTPPQPAGQGSAERVHVVTIEHLDAREASWRLLERLDALGMQAEDVRVEVVGRGNDLAIITDPARFDDVADALASVDRPPARIFLEAAMFSMTSSPWPESFIIEDAEGWAASLDELLIYHGAEAVEQPSPECAASFMIHDAADMFGDATPMSLLSTPQLLTYEGEPASVSVGSDIFATTTWPAHDLDDDISLRLFVEPSLDAEGDVRLAVSILGHVAEGDGWRAICRRQETLTVTSDATVVLPPTASCQMMVTLTPRVIYEDAEMRRLHDVKRAESEACSSDASAP